MLLILVDGMLKERNKGEEKKGEKKKEEKIRKEERKEASSVLTME